MREKQIPDDVLDVLKHATCDSDVLTLNGTLDRQLYLATNKVLEALSGKWNRKLRGHVFDGDAGEIIGDAVSSGTYIDRKQAFQYFPTPAPLAAELCERAGLESGQKVLEPSAGDGAIVRELVSRGAVVSAVEIDTKHAASLGAAGATILLWTDFLNCVMVDLEFDAVVMNPPFTRSQDIAHVMHAFRFLRPGGRLVSVMGAGWTFRMDRKAQEFRDWLADKCGTYEQLPDGAFRESGTMANAVVVEITR